jgi:NADPH-dependent ferric siderophore reductase
MTVSADPTASAGPDHTGRAENEALAERLGVLALSLRVERCDLLTPSCRRLRLVGRDLAALDPLPGQDLMISLDTDGERTRRRRYTIRHFVPAARAVDLDIALHGDGPGMRWAATVEPGAAVEAIGPRGKVTFDPPAQIRAFVAGPRWVVLDARPGDPAPLLAALADTALPTGRGHAYIGGEHVVVNALRDALVERGMDAESVNAKPYWRLGRQNAANGEPDRA